MKTKGGKNMNGTIVKTMLLLSIFTLAIVAPVEGKMVDLKNNTMFENHNVAIIKIMFNGTVGTPNAPNLATMEEPLVITNARNQTITVYLKDWSIDSSRYGVLLNVSNGTGPGTVEYLMPLERGWDTQIDEVSFGNIKVQIGMTEMFRGRTKEYVKFCVVVIKLPTK